MPTRKTIVINQSLAAANDFFVNIRQQVAFVPKHVIIRQLLYANIAGADSGTYLIWSSINSDYIGAVYVGIQGVALMPETIINLDPNDLSIDFRIVPANPAFTGPTGQLTMVLEFVESL